jgi:phosphohistidine phosphatase
MRHSQAISPAAAKDFVRWLTPHGRALARFAAGQVRERCPKIELIASSPLVRAVQTAETLAAEYSYADSVVAEESLATGHTRDVAAFVHANAASSSVALVGHEPSMRVLASHFAGEDLAPFSLATVVAAEWDPVASRGRVLWRLDPEEQFR